MENDRSHIVLALVCQVTRSREYFDDTDHTEEEEYHPDDLVSFKDVSYFLVHIYNVSGINSFLRDFWPKS
jgi:hypothetical protein